MKKFLIMIVLIIFTAMSVKADDLPGVNDLPSYMGRTLDMSTVGVDGHEWYQFSLDTRIGYVAGWLGGHLGLALMLGTSEEIRDEYTEDIKWLMFTRTTRELLYEIDLFYYSDSENLDVPIFSVLYSSMSKITWTEKDMERVIGTEQQIVPTNTL